MTARARVKQTATALSQYTFDLDAGAAADGMLNFRQGFQVPSDAEYLLGHAYWNDVPVLVETVDGWEILACTLHRDRTVNPYVMTLESSAERVLSSSNFNTSTRQFDPLAISASDAVTLSVVPAGASLLRVRLPDAIDVLNDPPTHGIKSNPQLGGLIEVGHRARCSNGSASVKGAMAIGDMCVAGADTAIALGYNNTSFGKYSAILGGINTGANNAGEACFGIGTVRSFQAGATPAETYIQSTRGLLHGATDDATPTLLSVPDPLDQAASGDTPTLTNSQGLYCDAGIVVFSATLVGIDVATGDTKHWSLKWAIKTDISAYTSAMFGSLTKTVENADAGASAWDCNVTVDSGGNSCSVEVTGEAATEIVWVLNYDARYATVYV